MKKQNESNDMQLELAIVQIEATVLALDESAFARLTSAARCGTPGFSGFNDQWGRKLSCPGYGQA